MQYNVHEAETNLSRLLELVAEGESIVIARDGAPVAELVPFQKKGIRIGAGAGDPLVDQAALAKDQWWRAMGDQEAEDFLEGR